MLNHLGVDHEREKKQDREMDCCTEMVEYKIKIIVL